MNPLFGARTGLEIASVKALDQRIQDARSLAQMKSLFANPKFFYLDQNTIEFAEQKFAELSVELFETLFAEPDDYEAAWIFDNYQGLANEVWKRNKTIDFEPKTLLFSVWQLLSMNGPLALAIAKEFCRPVVEFEGHFEKQMLNQRIARELVEGNGIVSSELFEIIAVELDSWFDYWADNVKRDMSVLYDQINEALAVFGISPLTKEQQIRASEIFRSEMPDTITKPKLRKFMDRDDTENTASLVKYIWSCVDFSEFREYKTAEILCDVPWVDTFRDVITAKQAKIILGECFQYVASGQGLQGQMLVSSHYQIALVYAKTTNRYESFV